MAEHSGRSTTKPTKTRVAQSAAAKAAATARKRAVNRATVARQAPGKHTEGFMNFIRQQGVVGLAVGLVLGTQIKTVVDQFLASFVNPVLGLVLPGKEDLSKKIFVFDAWGERPEFAWGQFIYVLLSFIIVALIIYYVVKALKLDKLTNKD